MSFSFSQSDEKELQPKPPKPQSEVVKAVPHEVVKPKKKSSQTTQPEKRCNQVKFYITNAQLKKFNELRGAVPASAFLFERFQELLK